MECIFGILYTHFLALLRQSRSIDSTLYAPRVSLQTLITYTGGKLGEKCINDILLQVHKKRLLRMFHGQESVEGKYGC